MCYWKDKLEVTDKEGHWIRPKDEKDMMIELQPEQELLPEEKAEIGRVESYGQGCKGMVVDDDLYKALRRVILDMAPVCVAKEGTEMNGRNLKPENVV